MHFTDLKNMFVEEKAPKEASKDTNLNEEGPADDRWEINLLPKDFKQAEDKLYTLIEGAIKEEEQIKANMNNAILKKHADQNTNAA